MTMRVTMNQTRMGEAGSLLTSGSTYTVSDAFGAYLVGNGFATDTDTTLNVSDVRLTAAQFTDWKARGKLLVGQLYNVDATLHQALTTSTAEQISGGVGGIPVTWGPFTASGVVKGVAGDPGTALAVFCSASSSGNVTLRNSATVGGGTTVSPLVTAVTMSAGQMIVCGPADCPNGIVLDLNSGTGTFYVIGV